MRVKWLSQSPQIYTTHNQTHLRSMLIFIVTKFGADWFIFVDARE